MEHVTEYKWMSCLVTADCPLVFLAEISQPEAIPLCPTHIVAVLAIEDSGGVNGDNQPTLLQHANTYPCIVHEHMGGEG